MVVSNFHASNSASYWKPVARPVPKSDLPLSLVKGTAPAVGPKPGGKVFVYVYEAPGNNGQAITKSGTLPPGAKVILSKAPVTTNGPAVSYPHSNELVEFSETPSERLQRRSKKSGKGYKVLADVNPNLGRSRGSSKGGKIFMKQKQRMDQFTTQPSEGKALDIELPRAMSVSPAPNGSKDKKVTKISASAEKYIPKSVLHSKWGQNRRMNIGDLIPRLHSPPPEWRAKVEADYRLYDCQTLPNRRWNTVDPTHRSHSSRSESAPPPAYQGDEDVFYSGSAHENRPSSGAVPAVHVNFDARLHKEAPHRKQGVRTGRGVFMTTPRVQHDFNARAIGWSRCYAEQY
ncbi:uncharacterized protein LOC143470978 [Clavelina lepadiformis]|uniref:uncharacterized protein LOC143470978 n=1 Tax=Clavelina lepadiformis TaxID=159417 RepID=UPI004041B663